MSDLCAFQFSLKIKANTHSGNNRNANFNSNFNKKYEWKDEKAGQYEYILFIEDEKFDELNIDLQQAMSSEHIDKHIKRSESLMRNICDPLFSKIIFLMRTNPYHIRIHNICRGLIMNVL